MSLFLDNENLIENLNHDKLNIRLENLKQLAERIKKGKLQKSKVNEYKSFWNKCPLLREQ